MIKPVDYTLELYKGASFNLQFRIKDAGGIVVDVSEWVFIFKAVKTHGGDAAIDVRTDDESGAITIDDNYVTLNLSADVTAAITEKGVLYFELDSINADNERTRLVKGQIYMMEAA